MYSRGMVLAAGEPIDIGEVIRTLVQGLKLVSDGITYSILFVLQQIGIDVPESALRVATIIVVALIIWRFGTVLGKIVLYALLFILVSTIIGFLPIGTLWPM